MARELEPEESTVAYRGKALRNEIVEWLQSKASFERLIEITDEHVQMAFDEGKISTENYNI